MRITQLQRPLRVAASGGYRSAVSLSWAATHRPEIYSQRRRTAEDANAAVEGRRWAAVKSQGAYKLTSKKTIPKKLGAKRSGEQFVIPGNIIYKQRGTIWHAGENTILGRDHSIHAAISGYVKYYRDPARHPRRQYIGVAYDREDKLPYPAHAVRKRKLGMVAVPRKVYPEKSALSGSGIPRFIIRRDDLVAAPATKDESTTLGGEAVESGENKTSEQSEQKKPQSREARRAERARIRRASRVLLLRKDYSYRENNAALGRLTSRAGGRTMGTAKFTSRHGLMRARRRKRTAALNRLTEIRQEKVQRVREMQEELGRKHSTTNGGVKVKAKQSKKGKKATKEAA